MSEIIERGAKAIHAEFFKMTMAGQAGDSADDAWVREAEYDGQDEYRAAARAMLVAMREPSEEMMSAILLTCGDYRPKCRRSGALFDYFLDVWHIMIDATLKDV